jgi:hypothetical protein
MKVTRWHKLLCYLFGHKSLDTLYVISNERSSWGTLICPRCGYEHTWQWDF